MKGGAFPGLAVDPDAAAHELAEALANSEAEAGAPELTRCRSIDLLEGFEQAVLTIWRNADATVTNGELEEIIIRMLGFACAETSGSIGTAFDFENHLALDGELYSVADEIDQDLAQPGDVTNEHLGERVLDRVGEVEFLLGGFGCKKIE